MASFFFSNRIWPTWSKRQIFLEDTGSGTCVAQWYCAVQAGAGKKHFACLWYDGKRSGDQLIAATTIERWSKEILAMK